MASHEVSSETQGDDLFAGWSDEARGALRGAMASARARRSLCIGLSDLASAVSAEVTVRSLNARAGEDPDVVAEAIGSLPTGMSAHLPRGALTADAKEVVLSAQIEATSVGDGTVRLAHLWLGILSTNAARETLAGHGIAADSLARRVRGEMNLT